MKKILNWKTFEENIYGKGWNSTSTGAPRPTPVQAQPAQVQPAQPGPSQVQAQVQETGLAAYVTDFKIPIAVEKNVNDDVFSYADDVDELVQKLNNDGFESDWLSEQFESWAKYAVIQLFDEEPERPDIDNFDSQEEYEETMDEYNAEMDEWNEQKEEYEEFQNMDFSDKLEKYIKDEWNNNWDKFKEEFRIYNIITEVCDRSDIEDIYEHIKEDFNESNLVKYFDEAEHFNIENIEVTGRDGGYMVVSVTHNTELESEQLDEIKEYLEGQCSDGWGEGFSQREVDGFYVHTWWFEDDKLPNYKIEIEKTRFIK